MARRPSFIKRYQVLSTPQIMQRVLLACIPGVIAMTLFFGWGTLINILWLSLWALIFESLVLFYRHRDPRPHLADYSAVLTAVLLGLCIPPGTPWWAGVTGVFFAIVVAKHCYGGLGQNIFNPAMVGYVVLLIAFPLQMSTWVLPEGPAQSTPAFVDSIRAIFLPGSVAQTIDAYTGATLLDTFKLQRGGLQVAEFLEQSPLAGGWSALGWEWVNLGFLAGGLYLLWRRIITWHIPVAMLLTLALLAALFHDGGSSVSGGSPLMHFFAGGTMLGAFFIATDPVTAATSPRGRLIYGALIGAVTYIIRAWGGYPDGIAFAVLLGNFAVPLIDYYSKPRTPGPEAT